MDANAHRLVGNAARLRSGAPDRPGACISTAQAVRAGNTALPGERSPEKCQGPRARASQYVIRMTQEQQRASIVVLCVVTLALCAAILWRWPADHERPKREGAPPVLQPGEDPGEPPTPEERFELQGNWHWR